MSERRAARVSVGVDVGGTFTDLVAVHAGGAVRLAKVLTTPDDRSLGVLQAVERGAIEPAHVERFVHGTTVVTNLLLERAGTRVVLLATAGFTDLLWLRRQERAALYDLTLDQPAPLVAPSDVIAVQERVAPHWSASASASASATATALASATATATASSSASSSASPLSAEPPDGTEVLQALTQAEIARVVDAARASGASAFAIVLLHGHAFTEHEAQLAAALREALPHATIAVSHDVLPEIREYERTATTVAEAYARPAVRRYMTALSAALGVRGFPSPRVMTSAGGTIAAEQADARAASLALSGPAGGVTAAAALCRVHGIADALTIDIGGTSADVGLVVAGEPLVERGGVLDGVPIGLPRVLVETVAAGGGSLGTVDAGGALHAGPESAGADPGPACYGRGGSQATVTDAHVVLGHIMPADWGGAVQIDAERAKQAMGALAVQLGRELTETARALIATADATMARALRRVSVDRGRDPRELVLIAFGGGGPLHACGLADALGMTRIFVPPWAGVLSALGLALAPERRDGLANVMRRCDRIDREELRRTQQELVVHLNAGTTGLTDRTWARMRYVGQGHELDVPMGSVTEVPLTMEGLEERFNALHLERFGYTLERLAEIVSLRVAVEGAWWPLVPARPVRDTPLAFTDRDDGLALDVSVSGPATVQLPDATLRVADGWLAKAMPAGGWWLTREHVS